MKPIEATPMSSPESELQLLKNLPLMFSKPYAGDGMFGFPMMPSGFLLG